MGMSVLTKANKTIRYSDLTRRVYIIDNATNVMEVHENVTREQFDRIKRYR